MPYEPHICSVLENCVSPGSSAAVYGHQRKSLPGAWMSWTKLPPPAFCISVGDLWLLQIMLYSCLVCAGGKLFYFCIYSV